MVDFIVVTNDMRITALNGQQPRAWRERARARARARVCVCVWGGGLLKQHANYIHDLVSFENI